MESNTGISLEVNDREGMTEDKEIQSPEVNDREGMTEDKEIQSLKVNDREGMTEDKEIQSLKVNDREGMTEDKEIQSMIIHHITAEISNENASSNMNQLSDKNEIEMCDDDSPIPNIFEHSIAKADVVCTYEKNAQITDEISEDGISEPTELVSINQQTASYITLNNYISMLSMDELSEGISKKSQTSSIRGSGISEQISSTGQLHKKYVCKRTNIKKEMKQVQPRIMTNKCKIALAILVGLVMTVLVVSLIVWGVRSRDQENIKVEPAFILTTIDFSDFTDSTDFTTTRSSQNNTSPANQKRPASIAFTGFTAWATSVVRYSAGTVLIFNGTDKEHDGFDRSTVLFTCPITGIYCVSVTLRKLNEQAVCVDVLKMDTRIMHFDESYTGNEWATISDSALVSCSRGEIIQMKGWCSGSIHADDSGRCSSFSVIQADKIAQNSAVQTFVAYSGYANYQPLNHDDDIDFVNPLCNVGNQFSYNRFTCPYTGIYFVSVTYWKYPKKYKTAYKYLLSARVYRNDTPVLFSHDATNIYNYVTNNALVRCNTGEYIESRADDTSYGSRSSRRSISLYVYGSGSYPGSIFTVMAVHQEDQTRPFIGFSRAKIVSQDYSAGDVITFTGVIMDDQNYFQANQFVCPVEGSYYFLLNLLKLGNSNIDLELKHGEKTVFKLEDTQSGTYHSTISNSAVIRCLKGEVVKV